MDAWLYRNKKARKEFDNLLSAVIDGHKWLLPILLHSSFFFFFSSLLVLVRILIFITSLQFSFTSMMKYSLINKNDKRRRKKKEKENTSIKSRCITFFSSYQLSMRLVGKTFLGLYFPIGISIWMRVYVCAFTKLIIDKLLHR